MTDRMKELDEIHELEVLKERKSHLKDQVGRFIDKLDRYEIEHFMYGIVKNGLGKY